MSRGIHLISNTIPGYILPDGKCQESGRTTGPSYSFNVGHNILLGANVILKTFPVHSQKILSLTCKAGPDNQRRNSDFSRQRKGSSRGKPHQERENKESLEESDPLSSKNGSILSLSSNPRYSATATPGRREKEIMELFRKVQAQLRERAAIKEEKKMEASQQGQGERGTVDSLLKLLRKHSVVQGKKSGVEEEFNVDQIEGSKSFEDEPDSNFFSSSNAISSEEVPEPDPILSTRPASSFRRRSPVPRVKFQPVFSEEDSSSSSSLKTEGEKKVFADEAELEPEAFEEPGEVSSDELSDSSHTEDTKEYIGEASTAESADLTSLKLVELRGLAKSRGIKGYSKLKKGELVELLSKYSS